MKKFLCLAAACGLAASAHGQGGEGSELEQLKSEYGQMMQRMEELGRRIEMLEREKSPPGAPSAPMQEGAVAMPPKVNQEVGAAPLETTRPTVSFGQGFLDLSFSTLVDIGASTADDIGELQVGGHDPIGEGFSIPSAELSIQGGVDPYFRGFSSIALFLGEGVETEIELEEAYLTTTSLPANLQAKAGMFFAEFGRHNTSHAHRWDFVDMPLVLGRFLGPDGLRNPGAQLSWLAPSPFYAEFFLTVMNGEGETSHSFRNPGEEDDFGVERFAGRATIGRELDSGGDLLIAPRAAVSFELTDTQTLLAGASAAFGPNSTGEDARTEVYGADLYWKWKPARARQGFPFVSFQTEALLRRFEAGEDPLAAPALAEETLTDWGFYAQTLWGFKPRWVAGLRGEYVTGDSGAFDDPMRADRARMSPNLTWYPSEFSKIRLQYNYDDGEDFGIEHSVWLQLEFFLGTHGAHTF